MSDQESSPVASPGARVRIQQWAERFVDVGFVCLAAAVGILFLVEGHIGVTVSVPVKVLILAAWCPFFWGKYAVARQTGRWTGWVVFAGAVVLTAATIISAIVILFKMVR